MTKQQTAALLLFVLLVLTGLVLLGIGFVVLEHSGFWNKLETRLPTPPGWLIALQLISLHFVLSIFQAAWVVRDARNRGMDGTAVWGLAVLFFGLPVFLVYMSSRPSGMLVACSRCSRSRLEIGRCPHCKSK